MERKAGFGVVRNVGEALEIAEKAKEGNLRGVHSSAAVVLAEALKETVELKSTPEFDFEAETVRTRSREWHGQKVSFSVLAIAVAEAVTKLSTLDHIKKTLFYGRELPFWVQDTEPERAKSCINIPANFHNFEQGVDFIHAVLGIATEAGELLEQLQRVIVDGLAFDKVNAIEEGGDCVWYLPLLANSCGVSFVEMQKINNRKLRKRYPEKFTCSDANNRDLEGEREVLEHNKEFYEFEQACMK